MNTPTSTQRITFTDFIQNDSWSIFVTIEPGEEAAFTEAASAACRMAAGEERDISWEDASTEEAQAAAAAGITVSPWQDQFGGGS